MIRLKNTKAIHIISMNIPWPADYGGVIDVFYKIRALYEAGYSIILHTFRYNRGPAEELEKYCKPVYYYKRKTGISSFFSCLPYIVYTRRSKQLLQNLQADDHPILFEGLHSCYYLDHPSLSGRLKLVRMHNIEHVYYRNLARREMNVFHKLYLITESIKLRWYEGILHHANSILSISPGETGYFLKKYGKGEWLSAFHSCTDAGSIPGKGKHILIHGDLSISENKSAIIYALNNILRFIDFKIIIAGRNPSREFQQYVRKHANAELIGSPDDILLDSLIRDAHINLLFSFNPSGLKLKLIHVLFRGRFVVVNPPTIEGSGLDDLVYRGDNSTEIIRILDKLMNLEFKQEMIEERKLKLVGYSVRHNLDKLEKLISAV